jgi:hypothetical protein
MEAVHNRKKKSCYDSIIAHISTSWLINDRPPLRNFLRRFVTPMQRYKFTYLTGWAAELADIQDNLWQADQLEGTDDDPRYTILKSEALELQAKCIPQRNLFRLMDESTFEYWKSWNEEMTPPKSETDTKKEEAKAAKENIISVSVTDNGKVKTIEFDKRPFGNISGDTLVGAIVQMMKGGDQTPTDGGKPSIKIDPTDVTPDAADEFKLTVSGKGLKDVKSAKLGAVEAKAIEAKDDGSLLITFKFPDAKEGAKPDLKLLDANGTEVATKKEAITFKKKAAGQGNSVPPATPATTSPSPSTRSATSTPTVTQDGTATPKPSPQKSP